MTKLPRKPFDPLRSTAKTATTPAARSAPKAYWVTESKSPSRHLVVPSSPSRVEDGYNRRGVGPRLDIALRDASVFLRSLERRHKLTVDEAAQVLRALKDQIDDPLYATQFEQDEHDKPTEIIEEKAPKDAVPDLPAAAPALWKERDLNRRENAPAFIARVYARWLGKGLERRHLATLDPDLYRALSVWVVRHPDDPIVSQLPPQHELVDELIEQLTADYPADVLRKLGRAIDSRMRRKRSEETE